MNALDIFTALKQLPYYRNYQAVSGSVHNTSSHEDTVEGVLRTAGLTRSNFKAVAERAGYTNTVEFRDRLLNSNTEWDLIPEGVYFDQPTGTHNSPDFIFKVNGKLYFLECKSGKGTSPMYNGGLPKAGYVYLFCSESTDSSTMYMGSEIVTPAQRALIAEFERESRERVAEFNRRLAELDENNRGLQYYQRHMWQQAGGADKTNYFTHERKNISESTVEERFTV